MVEKKTWKDWVFDGFNIFVMLIFLVTVLYSFLHSLAVSLNEAGDTTRGGITIFPRFLTWDNYSLVLQNDKVYTAYMITIGRTFLGTVLGLFLTSTLAYGLTIRRLKGRRVYIFLCLIPMYFSGGIVPFFLLLRSLGLLNSFWVYVIPSLINVWNMFLMRTFFSQLPKEMEESALLDGANYLQIYRHIIFPVSGTIFATIALFIGVMHWNAWYDAAMYVNKQELKPLQSVLISIVNEAKFAERMMAAGMSSGDIAALAQGRKTNTRSITMATMIITIIPILISYPFLQKYFVKGVMVGSVKG